MTWAVPVRKRVRFESGRCFVPWTCIGRGLVVLGLLVVGNVSCMVCPFTLPRRLATRWLPKRHAWPRALQSKWLAVALVAVFLWAYEAFALWDSPWWTAWITLGYFLAAFAVDGVFRGAAFCKYVCPIGQFNFVQSLVSPLEVAVCTIIRFARPATPKSASAVEATGIPGCELNLFQPREVGQHGLHLLCLDCVQSCPHANVGLVASIPGSQLLHDRFRSGIGRLGRRPWISPQRRRWYWCLGPFANAAGMVRPVVEWEQQLQDALGLSSARWIITIYYLVALVLAPIVAVSLASIAEPAVGRGLSLSRARIAGAVCLRHAGSCLLVSACGLAACMWVSFFHQLRYGHPHGTTLYRGLILA